MVLVLRDQRATFFNLDAEIDVAGQTVEVHACNPCLCLLNNGSSDKAFVLNVRWINSGYDQKGRSLLLSAPYVSSNSRLFLDEDLMPSSRQVLLDQLEGQSWSLGHQDVRLIDTSNGLVFLAGLSINGSVQQVLGSYDLDTSDFLKDSTHIRPTFPSPWGIGEKNWVFFPSATGYRIIHSWHPLRICEITADNRLVPIHTHHTPKSFKPFRGSTSHFMMGKKHAFIVHEVVERRRGIRCGPIQKHYVHRIVLLEGDEGRPTAISEQFKFSTSNIEFCCSAINYRGDIVVAGSVMDCKCFISRIDANQVHKQLRWAKVCLR